MKITTIIWNRAVSMPSLSYKSPPFFSVLLESSCSTCNKLVGVAFIARTITLTQAFERASARIKNDNHYSDSFLCVGCKDKKLARIWEQRRKVNIRIKENKTYE